VQVHPSHRPAVDWRQSSQANKSALSRALSEQSFAHGFGAPSATGGQPRRHLALLDDSLIAFGAIGDLRHIIQAKRSDATIMMAAARSSAEGCARHLGAEVISAGSA